MELSSFCQDLNHFSEILTQADETKTQNKGKLTF